MKKYILGSMILAGVSLSFNAEAQLLKKIQNAAQNAAQSAAQKSASEKAENASSNAMEGLLGGMMQPAPTESEYNFSGYMIMEITSTDKKGKTDEPMHMNYLLSKDTQFMGMAFTDPKNPSTHTATVIDQKNEAMVLFLEDGGKKSSMAMKMDLNKIQNMVDEEAEETIEKPDYEITKTGNTKQILGYTCEEYLVKSEDGEGHYWVSEKPIEGFSMFSPQSNPMVSNKTVEKYYSHFSNAPKGTFLEMLFKSTDGSVTDMKVIELELNSPTSFAIADYPNMMSGNN